MRPNGGPREGVHDLVAARYSPRAFADRPIAPELLRRIFEAGRWAASAYNEQPWRWLVATRDDETGFERLLSTLIPFNQGWAKHAAALSISLARTSFERNGKPNRHAFHDVGQAASNMAIEAAANGIAIHQMAGFDPDLVRERGLVAPGFEAVAAIALGYPGDPASLPADLRERELALRERRPLRDVVFGASFGQTAGFARDR
jgi:nitroreductase